MEIYGPSGEEAFERAMSRVLSGKPSQLARALVDDLCDHDLDGCCCHKFIFGLWRRSLPDNVKAGVAHLEFNATTFKQITTLADKIYGSNKKSQVHASVAAINTETHPGVLETGFHQNWPGEATQEVAALQQWRGGRGGRGRGRGRGRGNQNQNQSGQSQKAWKT